MLLGYSKVVKLLVENGANVNAENKSKYTALHDAVRYGIDL